MVKAFLLNALPATKIFKLFWTLDSGCPGSPAKVVRDEGRNDSVGGLPGQKPRLPTNRTNDTNGEEATVVLFVRYVLCVGNPHRVHPKIYPTISEYIRP